jgi:hypothetical protein
VRRNNVALILRGLLQLLLFSATGLANAQHRHTDHFTTHVVSLGMTDGYQVVIADLNNDQRPDLLAVASGLSELAWFENPTWQRHVITDGLTRPENAAVFDTDGDGIPEIGLVSGFGQNPQTSTGIVRILTHRGDPTGRWAAREIDRIPTSHRVRWADIDGSGQKVLINAPFVGPNAEAPDFRDDTPIVLYRPGEWQRELITTQEGLVHGLYIKGPDGRGRESIVTTGFAGIFANEFHDAEWQRHKIIDGSSMTWPKSGASEFTELQVGGESLMATVEPWHGNQVIVYRPLGETWTRHIIDTNVSLGHSLVTADLDGDGSEELIVADRGEARGVYLYSTTNPYGTSWHKEILDDDIMASGCTAGDINGDSRVDIACIDRMEELKWYENTGR